MVLDYSPPNLHERIVLVVCIEMESFYAQCQRHEETREQRFVCRLTADMLLQLLYLLLT